MISTRLFAQLGNQCFMIAAVIAQAKKMGTIYSIPKKTTSPATWRTYFNNLPYNYRATRYFYKEKRHSYDPLPEQSDLTIEGYFQSEKYFENAKQEVAEALGFEIPGLSYVNLIGHVSVHVRRGDYLLYPTQFPVLEMEYYIEAIKLMASRGFSHFKVHSDDIPWCKENFNRRDFDGLFISFSNERDALKDMKNIYYSDAMIIANSTFSLFPTLLRQDDPLVIAPKESRWYGSANRHLETVDLMPERFIKL
jgi:hypothetical protein